MKTLESPHSHHLMAALGWLDLGSPQEAQAELEQIEPQWHSHPDVMKTRWCIYAATGQWDQAAELGRKLRQKHPGDSFGWIEEAEALHQLNLTQQAWDVLLPAAEQFPDDGAIAYNLASYAATLGDSTAASTWLERAVDLEGATVVAEKVMAEPGLELLWQNLQAEYYLKPISISAQDDSGYVQPKRF